MELLEVNCHQFLERKHPSESFPTTGPSEAGHRAKTMTSFFSNLHSALRMCHTELRTVGTQAVITCH